MGTSVPTWWAIVSVCLLISTSSVRCEDVKVGAEPVYRPMADFNNRGDYTTTIPNPMDTIQVEGLLTGFQAFVLPSSNGTGCIILHVWRRTTRTSPYSSYPFSTTPAYYSSSTVQPVSPYWTFVGKTSECVKTDGGNKTITYNLPTENLIRVQKGDVIGYTANGSDPVAYSVDSGCSVGQRPLAPTGTRTLRYLRKSSSYSFTELDQCRNYSLQVTITKKACIRVTATRVPKNITFTSPGLRLIDECWIVEPQNKNTSVIKLFTRKLSLHSYDCDIGYLKINRGDSAPSGSGSLRRHCYGISSYERELPPISGAAYIHLWRRGGRPTTDPITFTMEYAALIESPCQNITLTETPTLIKSPGYPTADYQPNTKLCWGLNVEANSTNRIRVRLDGDFGIQNATCRYSYHTSCSYSSRTRCHDYIEVRDGQMANSPMLIKWCNTSRQTDLLETSSGQVMTIFFVTDSSIQAKGFQLKAFAVSPDTLQCSHYIALDDAEVLESPHYPFKYPNNRDDCWLVKANSKNNRILVTVVDSMLEDTVECDKDWIEVLDGPTISAPALRRWCGNTQPSPLLSSGPSLYFRFVSSSNGQYSGFRLSYKQITTEECTTYFAYSHKQYLNGEINKINDTSPRCWILQAEDGRLRVQWESVEQAVAQGNCDNTYIELYDGDSHNSKMIGKYCESKPIPKHGVHVEGSIIYVKWIVNSAPAKFRLAYMSLSARHCQMEFIKDYPVYLSSHEVNEQDNRTSLFISRSPYYYYTSSPRPDRPAPVGPCSKCQYKPNQQTCWVLESDQQNGRLLVQMSFLELQDKDSRGQCKDSVEIHDGRALTDPLMRLLCGNVPPFNLTSTGNAMLITFQSDATIQKRGFRMTVTNALHSTGCIQLDANNYNSSLQNPRSNPASGEKCWIIRSPSENRPIRVYAQRIHLQQEEIINFYDGPTNDAMLIKKFDRDTKQGAMVVSSGSAMTMVLKTGKKTPDTGEFMLHYSWLLKVQCAYKSITKTATSLKTDGYGSKPYKKLAYACWVLTSESLEDVIEIHAKRFHLEDGDKCTSDYVEIYDGPNKADDTLLHRWCGMKDKMKLAQSSGRSLYVLFTTDNKNQFDGFDLEVVAIKNPKFNNPSVVQPGAAHTEKKSTPIISESNTVVIVVVICAAIVVIVVVVAFARKRSSRAGASDDNRVVYRSHPAAGTEDMGALGTEETMTDTPPISRASSTGDTTKLV